jgi:ADP-ribose pyrophosphatase
MQSVGPRTILDRKITFADPRLRVRTDLYLTPQGEVVGPAHVIEAPDQVTIVALDPDGSTVVLVRRYRHGAGAMVTGLPSGMVERIRATHDLDAAETAAKRELLEQTGYAAGEWTYLLKGYPDASNQANAAYCFLATGLGRVPAPPHVPMEEADEIIERDLTTVLRKLQRGELVMDMLHAAALWSAASHIAADDSGRFGPLSVQLRRFLVGEDDLSYGEPVIPGAFPNAAVGG